MKGSHHEHDLGRRVYNPAEVAAGEFEVSVVMPCLNEARTVGRCVGKALQALKDWAWAARWSSPTTAAPMARRRSPGITAPGSSMSQRRGYGHALRGGIQAARPLHHHGRRGRFLRFQRTWRRSSSSCATGYDLVMGNRFQGGILPGAMPWLHRYVGNPVLTGILNLFFRSPIGDAHCGLRGFRKERRASDWAWQHRDGIRQRDGGQGQR